MVISIAMLGIGASGTALSLFSGLKDLRRVYAADLLGAGFGALAMVWLLFLGGPETSVFLISALLATGLLYRPTAWKARSISLLLIAVDLVVFFLHPAFIQPMISPYKPFALVMQFPGAERLGSAYSPYARVDLLRALS